VRRFRLLLLAFSLALLALVALLVQRALRSVEIERQMRHQTVAERVFDEMERGLSEFLEREEERSFDQYDSAVQGPVPTFVVGHFTVDPDGTVRIQPAPHGNEQVAVTAEIERAVGMYWRGGKAVAKPPSGAAAQHPGTTVALAAGARPAPVGVDAKMQDERKEKDSVSAFDVLRSLNRGVQQRAERQKYAAEPEMAAPRSMLSHREEADRMGAPQRHEETLDSIQPESELPPLAGRIVDARYLLLHRTVARGAQAHRQGLLVDVELLGVWLRGQGLGTDGFAEYASVAFGTPFAPATPPAAEPVFVYQHRFAEPFADLTARLALRPLPGVGGATYVYALSALLLATGVLGLAALYRMVSVVVTFAERRGNFVAAVSHELKTPLTAIRMYGEMLRDGMVPSETKRAEYYRHITVESERLSRLINNVLELSRLEKGNRQVALVTGALEPVVREVTDLLRPHVEAEGFDLRLEIDADLPPVRFERDAFIQVLCNLVDNAVKYARDASCKDIVLRCRHEGGKVSVCVRDHGPGVAAQHIGKIFEPFYRGENELTRRSKGTGIGLALVRGLAERMGARVSGRNVADGGFEVEIAFRAGIPPIVSWPPPPRFWA
jgi:signal transduction histidine kinase